MEISIEKARRISFFVAVEAAASLAEARSTRNKPSINAWRKAGVVQRKKWLSGSGKLGSKLLDELGAEFPKAAEVYDSPVWPLLSKELMPNSLANQLYRQCRISKTDCSLESLFNHFFVSRPATLGDGLEEVYLRTLALKVALTAKLFGEARRAATELATALLTLSGCEYRRGAAEQLWKRCGCILKREMPPRDGPVRYCEATWELISNHALLTIDDFKLKAYARREVTIVPQVVIEELLRDIVTAVTTTDSDRASNILHYFRNVSPWGLPFGSGAGRSVPDLSTVSIWKFKD